MLPNEPLIYALIAVGAIIAGIIVIYAMKKHGKKQVKPPIEEEKPAIEPGGLPFKIIKSVSQEEATRAKEELRILELERERLAQTYKSRMITVKDAISKDESLVALHELEAMQEDLIKLFSERFDEVSTKIEELRSKVEAKPIKEITIAAKTPPTPPTEETPVPEEKAKKKRKPLPTKTSPRTEAEKRIEEIRAEVEKVLERLGQMEIET